MHTHTRARTKRQGKAADADSERLCVEGVVSAGIFTALIININSLSSIHPLRPAGLQHLHDAVTLALVGQMLEEKKKSLKALIRNAFISSKGSLFLFFHLSTSSVAVSQLFDIFPEENVLSCNKPVVSRSSPHLTLLFPPPFFPNQ